MFRIAYLLPRLVILIACCLLLRLGIDPGLRLGLQGAGGSTVGAKVDVDRVNASLARGSLYVEGVRVTDPNDPLKNLVQFDGAWFELSNKAMLDRRVIIPHAVVQGLEFDTPRDRSGALDDPESEPSSATFFKVYRDRLIAQAGDRADGWFNDLEGRLKGDLRSEFQSVPLTEELIVRWTVEADRIRDNIDQWRERIESYQDLVRSIKTNPLRHLEALDQRIAEVQTIHRDLTNASRELAQLRQQMLADKQAISAAKDHDLQRVKELTQLDDVDPQALTEYLLGDELTNRLADISLWIERGRQLVDYAIRPPDLNSQTGRGIDFPFGGQDRLDFLIQELAFSGRSTAGSPFTFSGRATDLTHQMRRHAKPVVIELATSGSVAARVRSEVDFSGETPTYRFIAQCPRLVQPSYNMGDDKSLQVQVAQSPVALWLDVRLVGDQISGDVRWRQDELAMTPTLPGEHGKQLSAGLGEVFQEINTLHAVVQLAGSVDQPSWKVRSNLGNQLSDGLRVVAERQVGRLGDQLTARLDSEVAQQIGQLDQILDGRQASLREAFESLEMIQRQLTERWYGPLKRVGLSRATDLLR